MPVPIPPRPLPAVRDAVPRDLSGAIERAIARRAVAEDARGRGPGRGRPSSSRKAAARQAAVLSGSLALPPGPFGMLTVLPDLYLIWKTQRQMVADIFALYGRSAELTRMHMLYCLFRHAASQVLRDVAVRTGQRVVVQQLSARRDEDAIVSKVGVTCRKRVAGNAASRWVPLAGAAAVGAYAYWDTLQVAKTARRLLADPSLDAPDERRRPDRHVRPLRTAHASGRDRAGVRAAASAGDRSRATTSRRPRTCRSSAPTPRASASSRRCAGASCRAGRRTRRSARG